MNKLILLLAASDLEMNCLATLTGKTIEQICKEIDNKGGTRNPYIIKGFELNGIKYKYLINTSLLIVS